MHLLKLSWALALALVACSSKKITDDADAGEEGGVLVSEGGVDTGLPTCATGQYEATQAPTAILTLLQRSGSMSMNNKWVFAAQAIVAALDQDVFDTASVGLLAAPNSKVNGPACVFNFPVACGVPAFPQVDLKPAGKNKSSDATGVRRDIKNWLTTNSPDQSVGDGNPLYNAIQAGIGALQAYKTQKRILFVITDGAISCTSLSNRPGYTDGNGCKDWEYPQSIVTLVQNANKDMNAPVETFIVGVPGSDTFDPSGVQYPPYQMLAALSAIAKAGSPSFVPQSCTSALPFNQNDPKPMTACHFDMNQNYTAQKVADAISQVRGAVLGCTFDLPKPMSGTIDLGKVNVSYSVGGPLTNLYKRKDAANMCSLDGCWDYNANQTQIELVGKACQDVKGAPNAKVSITVGCATEVR